MSAKAPSPDPRVRYVCIAVHRRGILPPRRMGEALVSLSGQPLTRLGRSRINSRLTLGAT
jgi:hypothetical protein